MPYDILSTFIYYIVDHKYLQFEPDSSSSFCHIQLADCCFDAICFISKQYHICQFITI